MPTGITNMCALRRTATNQIYLLGGQNGTFVTSAMKYDIDTKNLSFTRNEMKVGKALPACTIYEDQGSIFVGGGSMQGPSGWVSSSTAELFDLSTEQWTDLRNGPINYKTFISIDNQLFIFNDAASYRYNLQEDDWTETTEKIPGKGQVFSVVLVEIENFDLCN